jgi:hypothetical protein
MTEQPASTSAPDQGAQAADLAVQARPVLAEIIGRLASENPAAIEKLARTFGSDRALAGQWISYILEQRQDRLGEVAQDAQITAGMQFPETPEELAEELFRQNIRAIMSEFIGTALAPALNELDIDPEDLTEEEYLELYTELFGDVFQ